MMESPKPRAGAAVPCQQTASASVAAHGIWPLNLRRKDLSMSIAAPRARVAQGATRPPGAARPLVFQLKSRSCSGSALPTRQEGSAAQLPVAILYHAEQVAAVAARMAGQFIHQLAHQEDAPAAQAHLCRVEFRHFRQIERPTFVEDMNFNPI